MPIPKRLRRHRVELAGAIVDTPEGPRHGAPRVLDAYQEESQQTVEVEGGQVVLSTVQVWLDPTPIELGDLVTVHTMDGASRQLRVLVLEQFDGDPRAAHTALKLG